MKEHDGKELIFLQGAIGKENTRRDFDAAVAAVKRGGNLPNRRWKRYFKSFKEKQKMTTDELNKLEALAKAATPGPWIPTLENGINESEWWIETQMVYCREQAISDSDYIAAVSPEVVLGLIKEVKRKSIVKCPKCNETMLTGPAFKLMDENESLRAENENLKKTAIIETVRELRAQLAEAGGVVEFYADKENWDDDSFTPTCWDDGQIDLGERARAYLEKYHGKS